MSDLISRQAAMERLMAQNVIMDGSEYHNGFNAGVNRAQEVIRNLPTAQPKIIHCKDCEHWKLQIGNVKGDGLGSCDFHNVNLVTGEGFCYWAEKRGEADG